VREGMSGADPDSEKYWKSFVEQIDDRYWIIFGRCFDIFREAVLCYQAEAYLAACIMCRSSIEAMLHLAKTITKFGYGVVDRHLYGSQKDNYPSFTQLKEWTKREHLLDGLESKVDDIQNDGDFGAHLAQKTDQRFSIIPENKGTSIQIWKRCQYLYIHAISRMVI